MRRFAARFKFSCNLVGNRPKFLTAPIVIRYAACIREKKYLKYSLIVYTFVVQNCEL